jgi:hypothetical protein
MRRAYFVFAALAVWPMTLPLAFGATGPRISLEYRQESSVIRHAGSGGQFYGLLLSSNTVDWELVAMMTQAPGGTNTVTDLSALYRDRQFYQVCQESNDSAFAWMENYGGNYDDGDEVDAIPFFSWTLYPYTGVTYQVEIFTAVPTGDGGLAPVPRPILSVSGLTGLSYSYHTNDPPLWPGTAYFYSVSARQAARLVRGRPRLVFGHGAVEAGIRPTVQSATDWRKLLKLLHELEKRKQELDEALRQNPINEERELYKQLAQLLANPEEIKATLDAILERRFSELQNPETVLKGLCYLEQLVRFLATHEKNLSERARQRLKQFADRLAAIKKELEEASDRGAKLQETLQQLENLINDFTAGGMIDFLRDFIKKRLLEKLRELLVKKLGEKGAGALFSIFEDLSNLTDLLLTVSELDDLCRRFNRLLLDGIEDHPTPMPEDDVEYFDTIPQSFLDKTVSISVKKRCWKPDPDGGPDDGTWETSTVPFADGSTTKSAPAETLVTGEKPDGRKCIQFPVALDPAGFSCPPGTGPCIVFGEVTYTCPDPPDSFTIRYFIGVIKCP